MDFFSVLSFVLTHGLTVDTQFFQVKINVLSARMTAIPMLIVMKPTLPTTASANWDMTETESSVHVTFTLSITLYAIHRVSL